MCLKSLFSATIGIASRFSSMRIRVPVWSESSLMSEISVSTLAWISSATLVMTPSSPPFLTM